MISPILILLLLILIPAILTPYFETNLMVKQYQLLYSNLGKICHQFPTHSFYIFGSNMGLCSRCFSIYFALFVSSILLIFFDIKLSWRYRFFISFILAVPLLADGFTQLYNLRESNNYLRLTTGILFGLGVALIFTSFYINYTVNFLINLLKKEDSTMKSLCCKINLSLLLTIIIFSLASLAFAGEITIKAGTPIPVKLLDDLSSETATAGQSVRFEVTRNIAVDDKVVIKAGSEVVGEVTYAQKTGSLGKEGNLYLVVRYATAVDGTRVPLRANLSATGDEKVALSWMVCPFIKGTGSRIPAATETKAYVDYDTVVKIN